MYNSPGELVSFPFPGSASRQLLHINPVPPTTARVPGLRSHTADGTRLVLHVSQPEKPFSTVPSCLGTLAPAAGHSTHEDSCSEKPVCGLQQGLRQRQTLGQHKPGRCSVGAAGLGCWGAAPFCAQTWLADPLPAPGCAPVGTGFARTKLSQLKGTEKARGFPHCRNCFFLVLDLGRDTTWSLQMTL